MHLLIPPRSTVFKLASIAAGFVIVGVLTAYLRIAHDLELAQLVWLFDLAGDRAFPTWYASLMLLAASLLAFVAAGDCAGHMRLRDRRCWIFLGAVLMFLSADEVGGFHEWTGDHAPEITRHMDGAFWGLFFYGWIVFGLFAAILVALLFAPFILRQPARLRGLLILSGAVFVGGALGVEMISSYLAYNHPAQELLWMLVTALEESLEFAGVLIFIYALLDDAQRRGLRVTPDF